MPYTGIRMEGLRDLQVMAEVSESKIVAEIPERIRQAAEPIRVHAQDLASAKIRNITPAWQEIKLGTTLRSVYVAPAAHRRRGSHLTRPNLGRLLVTRALQPAVDEGLESVAAALQSLVDEVFAEQGLGGER